MDQEEVDKYLIMFPNMIPPYGYELVQIMAYPSGFVYRFRFDEEWVQEKIKNNDLQFLEGKRGYIVFRDKATARFYPIRYFTILKAERIGKVYYFSYELNNTVDFESKEDLRTKQLDEFNTALTDFHKDELVTNQPGKDMKPIVLLSNFELVMKNGHPSSANALLRENERWVNVISTVKSIKLYEDIEFVKIIEVISMKKSNHTNVHRHNNSRLHNVYYKIVDVLSMIKKDYTAANVKDNSLVVSEYEDYKLKLLQYIPTESRQERHKPRDIELKGDDKYVRIIRGRQRAVGKYDVLTYIFRTLPDSGGTKSFLDLEMTLKPGTEPYMESKIFIPIFIKIKIGKVILKLSLAAVFVSVFLAIHFHPNSVLPFLKDVALIGVTIIVMELFMELKGFLRRK
jgi:hypothetical protein